MAEGVQLTSSEHPSREQAAGDAEPSSSGEALGDSDSQSAALGGQHQHHQGMGWKCRFLGPNPIQQTREPAFEQAHWVSLPHRADIIQDTQFNLNFRETVNHILV